MLQELRTLGSRPHNLATTLADLGLFQAEMDNWSTASAYLEQAHAIFARLGIAADEIDSQALRARCLSHLGQQEQARQLAIAVWSHLRVHGTGGLFFPSRVYVALADIASAIETPHVSPRKIIEAGYHDLMQRAEKISNAEWQQSFLENVKENRELVERWKQMQ